MARLAQLSELQSERARAMLALLLQFAPLVRFMDAHSAFEEDATDYDWRPVDPESTIKKRAIGGEYTPTDATPGAKQTASLAFMGESIDIDDSHKADARRNLRDFQRWLDREMERRGRSWAKLFNAILFSGSGAGAPTEIKGLKTLLNGTDDLPGYTGVTGVIDASTWTPAADDSFDLSVEANWGTFIENLMLSILLVPGARGLIVAPELHARMYTIAQEKHILGETRDSFGNIINTFGGTPFVPMNDGDIGTDELDNNGTTPAANTTSIYIARPGEMDLSLVTNSGLEFDDEFDLEKKESQRVKWEFRGQWKIEEKDSIRRIRNIKLYA